MARVRWIGAVVMMVVLAAACGTATDTATTSESSAEMATTATTAPAIAAMRAGPVGQWGDATVSTVCVRSDQTYPQLPEYRLPIETWAAQLLNPIGVSTVAPDAPCDATFSVTVSIEVFSAEYGGAGHTYFTGHHRYVDIALEAPDREPITTSFPHEIEPGEWATNLSATTPQEALDEQAGNVAENVMDTAMQIWGPAVAVEALCMKSPDWPAPHFEFLAGQLLIDAAGIRDTYASGPKPNDYESWRHWAETGEVVQGQGTTECPPRA